MVWSTTISVTLITVWGIEGLKKPSDSTGDREEEVEEEEEEEGEGMQVRIRVRMIIAALIHTTATRSPSPVNYRLFKTYNLL